MDIAETCMSSNIKNHYDLAKQGEETEAIKDVLNGFGIDFAKVHDKLQCSGVQVEVIGEESAGWFQNATKILLPILHTIHRQFKAIKGNFEQTSDLLVWTSQSDHFDKCWEMLKQNDDGEHTLEVLLLLTPILERSLGNLLISVNGSIKVPALLRDLLKRSELFTLLGAPCMTFLRIIFGSPHSLNLRNIVWHGFGFPGEISNIFSSVTLLIFTSIGSILKQKSFKLVQRKMLSVSRIQQIDEQNKVDLAESLNPEELFQLAKNSKLFYAKNLTVLNKIYSHLKSGDFSLCSVLLLPLLEVTFRKLFVIENDCPDRMLTAEAECMYTTYNEIFEEHLENGKLNTIQNCLGEDLMLLMYDLLTLPEGPRVRDKLSHGEVPFSLNLADDKSQKVMKTLANHLLTVLIILLSKNTSSHQISKDLSEVLQTYQSYKSLFHPSTLLVNSLLQNLADITIIDQVESPANFEFENCERNLFSQEESCSALITFMGSVFVDTNDLTNLSRSEILLNINEALKFYKGSTLYRPRQEYEVLTLLQKISDQISLACERVVENMKEKLELFETKEMRSRQRVTYKRMLETIPKFKNELLIIIFFIFHSLVRKDEISLLDPGKLSLFVKYLKRVLKICENICAKVHIQKNTWDEVDKLLIQLKALISEYKTKFS